MSSRQVPDVVALIEPAIAPQKWANAFFIIFCFFSATMGSSWTTRAAQFLFELIFGKLHLHLHFLLFFRNEFAGCSTFRCNFPGIMISSCPSHLDVLFELSSKNYPFQFLNFNLRRAYREHSEKKASSEPLRARNSN